MAEENVHVEVEVPVETPEPEPVLEPAVEAAAAGVAVAEAAVALSEQVTAAAELEAAALEVVGSQENSAWRQNLETTIFSRLTEMEARQTMALEALATEMRNSLIRPEPLIVETPQGEELILPAEELQRSQESGAEESPVLQTKPKRHRWI
jgi:hypothetical protein